jgi:hypothetical protein
MFDSEYKFRCAHGVTTIIGLFTAGVGSGLTGIWSRDIVLGCWLFVRVEASLGSSYECFDVNSWWLGPVISFYCLFPLVRDTAAFRCTE